MNFEILLSKLLRLPLNKALDIYNEYLKNNQDNFANNLRASNLLMEKTQTRKRIKDECFETALMALAFMSQKKNQLADMMLEETKPYPMIVWMEVIGEMDDEGIKGVLKNYADKLPSPIIETLILNLSEPKQAIAINKYKNRLDSKSEMFYSFYLCLSKEAQQELDKLTNKAVKVNPLLQLSDQEPSQIKESLIVNKELYKEIPMDDIIEVLLLNVNSSEDIFDILKAYEDRQTEISDMRFKLLVGRLKVLLNEETYNHRFENAEEIFNKLKSRFKRLGLKDSLAILDAKVDGYYSCEHGNEIIYEFLDIAYENENLRDFVNEKTISALVERFVDDCRSKEYTVQDFRRLVEKTTTTKPYKLIKDDYIEAIIACGSLMKNHIISDQDPHFLELRRRFISMLNDQVEKDGTLTEKVNFNGLFYRLIKGSVDFDKVFNTKTYKGLIYLTKSGRVFNNPDLITKYLSDEQIRKLDISPVLHLKKELINEANRKHKEVKPNSELDPRYAVSDFKERMMLQLLCYFGETRARHIIKSAMKTTRMENIFDSLNYKDIKIDENGKPIVNQELVDFLFGRGSVAEKNTVMNRIIREELLDFGRFVPEICNNYEEVKKACHGIITVKRAMAHFEDIVLPIELKPNEREFKPALKEMRITKEDTLAKGVSLCHDAKKRTSSTIPKVKGKLGDFTYEILDVKDPFALAVGYLSHCCFVVDGISYSALKHSMQSVNGRTFVVYHKGKFLTQSWMWRNGDVVCFDSVESGSSIHGAYNDDIKLVDVYKHVADEIMDISKCNETDAERVKVVTVGASDYIFKGLPQVEGKVPRPQERDVYVYDSSTQGILAGEMPKKPNYDPVSIRYKDPRKRVHKFLSIEEADVDDLDEALLKLQSIKYESTGSEEVEDITTMNQLFVGQDWYIKTTKDGTVEVEILGEEDASLEECKRYAELLGIEFEMEHKELNDGYQLSKDDVVKQLRKTKLESRRG